MGGGSRPTSRVVSRARERGLHVTVQDIFERQTVRELAGAVAAGDGGSRTTVAPFALVSDADRALLPAGVVDAYPLTTMQAGMIFEAHLAGRPAYQHVISFH